MPSRTRCRGCLSLRVQGPAPFHPLQADPSTSRQARSSIPNPAAHILPGNRLTGLRGPVGITKLGEMTFTECTTLTRNLRLLEKKELIRIAPWEDRRDRLVSITEKGRYLLLEATELWKTAQAHIENGLGEDRMNRLYANLSEVASLTRNA